MISWNGRWKPAYGYIAVLMGLVMHISDNAVLVFGYNTDAFSF